VNERAYYLLGIPSLHEDAFRAVAGHMRLYGKGGSSAPLPDPAIGQAALQNVQLGKDWLDFANQQFKEGNIRQADLDALTKRVTESQLAAQDTSNKWAAEDRDRYKSVFQPLQDAYIDKGKRYASAENQGKNAAEAVADVNQGAAQARAASTRNMAAMGITPSSGRFEGISRAQETLNGLSAAGAVNTARQQTRDKGDAMLADAINMGNWRANQGVMQSGFQGAMGGYSSGAGILNQQYGNRLNAWGMQQQANAQSAGGLISGIGQLAGAGIGAYTA
jgi:hypothetical protein